jgi:erythritol kinase
MGDFPEEIRVTGGAARSNALRLMLASTLKARVRSVTRDEAGAAGAAMMAAVQQKLYPDMAACAAQWVDPLLGDSTAPDACLSVTYDNAFKLYKETREKMQPVWRAMMANRKEATHAS